MPDRTDIFAWHRVGGDQKADAVLRLAPPGVERIIEIGCGTGAVLEALDRRGFGRAYWACEPTPALYGAIPTERIRRLVGVAPLTFDQAFLDEPTFDLGIVTHVVEHLRTPAVLLSHALERCRYVLVEVPIEDNVLGRCRVAVKRLVGRGRLDNAAGHVQFFSRATARALVRHAGGTVVGEHGYFPIDGATAAADRAYQRAIATTAAVSPFLGRRYYEHFAMLATAVQYDSWHGNYVRPE